MTRTPGIQRIDGRRSRWPLHGTQASREIEAQAAAARLPHALMAAAGLAVARLAHAIAPHAQHIHVWAGPGNNGGDGLVAATHLHRAGRTVLVTLLADPDHMPLDANWALQQAHAAGVNVSSDWPEASQPVDLCIDALLGLGISRAPEGLMAQAIAAINRCTAAVLAIDLPSGLQADTGCVLGDPTEGAAVRATATLALLTLKPGCHTAQGRDHAGELWFDDLGVALPSPDAWLGFDTHDLPRLHASHKGSYGDVCVVGGAPGMGGAAWLASRAALAGGAGRVICSLLDDNDPQTDPLRPELMTRRTWWRSAPDVLARATVVCGCGGGTLCEAALPPLLASAGRLVLDADALNAVAADAALQAALKARHTQGLPTILTPHPLEAARLLGCSVAAIQSDRLRAAAALSKLFKTTVVLKGSGTVLASPDATPLINATGNAALATAGSGDVLAGWTGGLWAQSLQADPFDLASRAVASHGAAADEWRAQGHHGPLLASDLIATLARR